MQLTDKFKIIIPPQDIDCHPELQQKLADGDRAAFAWVYKNYCRKVYDYALLITNNKTLSDDIVQDVFVKLWMKKEKLKGIKNFNGFLYMLYRNHITDVLRQQKLHAEGSEFYFQHLTNTEPAIDELMMEKQLKQLIQSEIKKLPQQQQLVYTLVREYGMRRCEIAKSLKLSENTVKNHMYNAVGKLRERLAMEK